MEQTPNINQTQQPAQPSRKWSFAAFFGTWVWLFANKQTKMGTAFLLFWIVLVFLNIAPLVGINMAEFIYVPSATQVLHLAWFGFSIWLGIRGREIVWKSGVWQTAEIYEQQQKKAGWWVVAYFVTLLLLGVLLVGFLAKSFIDSAKSYADNPELLENRAREEMLQDARIGNPGLDEAEFNEGYASGMADGAVFEATAKLNPAKTSSYQEGYWYGYMISCMNEHDNEIYCLEQAMLGQ